MSIDIATELREEAGKARKVAELVSPDDRKVLVLLAPRLIEISERLERDPRD